ncbi:radical SAM protein [Candidatus Parcubacteria bacterium]|nr:radical SAM protein [Candidatus Parcubacteria bacterium]
MKDVSLKNKFFYNNLIRLGMECNQQCVFCNITRRENEEWQTLSTDQAKHAIDGFSKNLDIELSFSGGEPTIRNDLPELISHAKKMGVKRTQIQTNAIVIDDVYAKKLKLSGLDSAFVAFHSHIPEIQDELTKLKGSFRKTIRGIQALHNNGIEVVVNIVVNKKNFKYFKDYVIFVADTFNFIRCISVAIMQPHGRAANNLKELLPRYSDVARHFEDGTKIAKKRGIYIDNHYCSLPLCFLPEEIICSSLEYKENELLRKSPGSEIPERIRKIYSSKVHGVPCQNCILKNFCNGIWREYINLYGWNDIKPYKKSYKYF